MISTPSLQALYTRGSLRNDPVGVAFSLKNRLTDLVLHRLVKVRIGSMELGPEDLELELGDGAWCQAIEVTKERPRPFALKQTVQLRAPGRRIGEGVHPIEISVEVQGFGAISFEVEDSTANLQIKHVSVPHSKEDNYSATIIEARQAFVEKTAGVDLHHTRQYSFDPRVTEGNIENFTGVVQIPLGFAGPLLIKGEHAQGEFLIPLATTEGTLVASYNRGMKVLNLSGGVLCTVQDDCMQRAPVFIFDSAREARSFQNWVNEHLDDIRRQAEATTGRGKLSHIEIYLASKCAYLRFNFTTGDAAGQNMVSRATFAACNWILEQNKSTVRRFYLESNLATDKKASHVNLLHSRGKRVTAECTIKRNVLREVLHAEPESLACHWGVANVGAILSGANNNGLHSTNAIAAMFMATGQDVANVAEGTSGIIYLELTPEKDLYTSITIPSLIVATHGGGTGLATQRECLEVLGCFGSGKVRKLAEIVAGVVLAGEISLAAAISSMEWVSSHEKHGRNR
jgi:hydroxymethylglutaryl-CoA reductase (NADPH)